MNKRQKKKAFKKKYGFNPPSNIRVNAVKGFFTKVAQKIKEALKNLKDAMSNLWRMIKPSLEQLIKPLIEIGTISIEIAKKRRETEWRYQKR